MARYLLQGRWRRSAGRTLLGTFCLFSTAFPLPILQSKSEPAQILLAQGSGTNRSFYDKARRELGEPYYTIYRVVDRLARANDLDQWPWRVKVEPAYDINAFASETNRLSIATGLIDQLAGDSAAIACVMGHEMAHHVLRHNALKEKDVVNARQRVSGGEENAAQDLLAASRTMEMEADRSGYVYMARAGFDPQGCMRLLDVMARQSSAEFDTTHPAIPRRIEQMRQLIQSRSPATLAAEGKARLRASRPLTYALSHDHNSLRINSRIAGFSQAFPDDL